MRYYGYRYYSPLLGRWISRDPLEEQGGVNLLGFIQNMPANCIDLIGLRIYPPEMGVIVPPGPFILDDASVLQENAKQTIRWVSTLLSGLYSGDISTGLNVASPTTGAKNQLAALMGLLRDSREVDVRISITSDAAAGEVDDKAFGAHGGTVRINLPICPMDDETMRRTLRTLVHEALHVFEVVQDKRPRAELLSNGEVKGILSFIGKHAGPTESQASTTTGSKTAGDRELLNSRFWTGEITKQRNPGFKWVEGSVFDRQTSRFVPGETIVVNDYLVFWLLGFDPVAKPWPNPKYDPSSFKRE